MFGVVLVAMLVMGCIGVGPTEEKETVLRPNQGVGVVPGGVYVLDSKVKPGAITSVVVKVRNNLEGQPANNIVVTLDNVAPLRILCRGGSGAVEEFFDNFPNYKEGYEACGRDYSLDLDSNLKLNQHGVVKLDPGEEVEFIWPIRTPDRAVLAGMKYEHTLYYTIDYDYKLKAQESIVYLSNQEYLRLKQENKTLNYPSTFRQTAGEFKLYPQTVNPFLYYPSQGIAQVASINYNIENNGDGFIPPDSKLVIVLQYPKEMEPDETYSEKRWIKGTDLDNERIKSILKHFPDINLNRILYKELDPSFLRKGFRYPISAPLTLTQDELNSLIENSIPSKTYNIQVYVFYKYRFEKSSKITIYPVEI